MSSTDEARLRRFYRERLAPAARRIADRGVVFFPLGPEPRAETWYSPAPTGPDFTALDENDCGRTLRDHWRAQGLDELAALADEMMELARGLEVAEEDSSEISPFVYVMY